MPSAEVRHGSDATAGLNITLDRAILVQREMRLGIVVFVDVCPIAGATRQVQPQASAMT